MDLLGFCDTIKTHLNSEKVAKEDLEKPKLRYRHDCHQTTQRNNEFLERCFVFLGAHSKTMGLAVGEWPVHFGADRYPRNFAVAANANKKKNHFVLEAEHFVMGQGTTLILRYGINEWVHDGPFRGDRIRKTPWYLLEML